ncbi:MAG TPA: hypothetical protein VEZ91_09880 [Kurthia gibsonii]|nr:hypothetical protein [Kurthia gibsonii]
MKEVTNCFVVIPSAAKENTEADKLSVKQMLNDGIAIGFRGSLKRVKAQRFILIVDKQNKKAYCADILKVDENTSVVGSKIPRVDVSFGIIRSYDWESLMGIIQVESGQSNTRFVWLTGFHRS